MKMTDEVIEHSKLSVSSTRQIFEITGTVMNKDYYSLANLYWESLKIIAQMIPALDRLQDRLEAGDRIVFQDGKWRLFDSEGEQVCSGDSIRDMLISLIMVDC